MNCEQEVRLKALELAIQSRAEWQPPQGTVEAASVYADFILGSAGASQDKRKAALDTLVREAQEMGSYE